MVKGETFIVSSTGCATNVRITPPHPPPPSSLRCPSSGIRLSSNVQTAAAIIALLNDLLISRGKHSLGFLNYWLYEAGLHWDGLNDIISGNNPGCKTEGFSATDGWDPVRRARPLSLRFRLH